MQPLRLEMALPNLENLPDYPLPTGYHLRLYNPGDELLWAQIEHAVGDFDSIEKALSEYQRSFSAGVEELCKRQLFLFTDSDEVIGTTTAWMTERYEPGVHGLIHWVAIKPEYQANKLGRPLVSAALKLMRTWHTRAFLCTQTHRHRALRVYLDLGFVPYIREDTDIAAWRTTAASIAHPSLKEYVD